MGTVTPIRNSNNLYTVRMIDAAGQRTTLRLWATTEVEAVAQALAAHPSCWLDTGANPNGLARYNKER